MTAQAPEVRHPLFARLCAVMSRKEPAEVREHRRELLSGLSGRILTSAFAGNAVAGRAGAATGVASALTSAVAGNRARAAASSPLASASTGA